MKELTIKVADQFTPFPSGRFETHGPYSGEKFRKQFLEPNIELFEIINIELDGTMGYGSSFLEEAFGGLLRKFHLQIQKIYEHPNKIEITFNNNKKLIIKSSFKIDLIQIKYHIENEHKRQQSRG